MKLTHSFAFVLALLVAPRSAHATPGFPAVIERELKLSEAPPCTLCHVGTPARGTVETPFGKYLVSRGLKPRNDASLVRALQAAQGERQDSNGNGITDIDEIKAGKNPNGDEPEFGCVGSVAPAPNGSSAIVAALALVLTLMLTRRTRRKR